MSGVGPDVLALPRGGGAVGGLGGGFVPDLNTGGGGYAVPLDLPAGVDGHTPQLTLQYGTGHGNGPFGLGWALTLPTVQVATEGRVPAYDGTDDLVVPGAGRLVPAPDDPDVLVPETDGLGWRVRRSGDGFEVTDRSGLRHVLGTSPGARVADPADATHVHTWLLERSVRPAGQEITYAWTPDHLLADVTWAAYRVDVRYEDRPDPVLDARAGFLQATTRRAVAVELHAPAQTPSLLRRYTLDYTSADPTGHSLLAGVTLTGHGADGDVVAFPRLALGYTDGGGFGLRAVGSALAGVLAAPGGTLADLTGDGLPDGVLLGAVPTVVTNRGDLAFDAPRALGRGGLPDAPPGSVTFPADLTGRGRVDLVTVGAGLRHRYPVDHGALGAPVVDRYAPTFVPWDPEVRLLDLDGDGATDLLVLADGVLTTVTTGPGGAWDEVERRVVGTGDPLAGVDLRSPDVHVAPMTGSGRVDLVEVRSGRVRWWPNLGGGRWGAPVTMAGSPVLPAGHRPDRLLLVDVDGDGCADLVLVDDDAVRIWHNRGGTTLEAEVVVAPVPGVTVERVEPVDLRGTGCTGLLLATRHGSRPAAYHLDLATKPYLLDHVDDGLGHVTRIRYGTSTTESVRDAGRGRTWSTSLPFPVPVVTAVERDLPEGATRVSTFRYHDGHWDPALRRFLGFAVVDETELGDASVDGLLKRTEFHLGRTPERLDAAPTPAERVAAQVLRGRVVRSAGYRTDADPDVDDPLFEVRQEWQAHVTPGPGSVVAAPRLVRRREDHLDGASTPWRSTVTATLAWDVHGNVTEQVQRTELAADPSALQEVRTVTTFAVDPAGRVLDKPARVTQTDGTGVVVDDRVLRYDGPASEGLPVGEVDQGLLTHEERLVLRDDQVAQVYGADVPDLAALGYHRRAGEPGWWVHAVRYERSAGRLVALDPRGTPVTLELDADLLFPARRTDARGNVVEAQVDRRALRLASLTDGNGGLRRNTYDALGRLVAEHRPGDGADEPTVEHTYLLGAAGPQVEVREHPSADRTTAVTTRRLLDSEGEEAGVARRDADGSWVVTEAVRRNARGLTSHAFLPYRAPAGPDPAPPAPDAPHTATRYDALGRPVRVELPGGGVRLGVHEPGRSDLWDEEDTRPGSPHEGTPTSFHLDGAGRVARVVHRLADAELVTAYRYDLRDQLVAVTDANGRTTTVTYDLLGRRVRVDDPSTGSVVMVHDAAGNVVERRNAAGQRARQEFDVLNRLVRATQDGGTDVVHTYLDRADVPGDAAPGRRVGRLASVTDARGTVTFDYDVRGEVEQRRVVLPDGTAHTLRRRTDRLGRVTAITYPGGGGDTPGPVLTYGYDARGMLASVPGVVDAIERDVAGNPVLTRFTGGARTERTYDALLRPASTVVRHADGTELLREDLTRDLTGTVASVTGLDPADTWTYAHDALGRLVRATPGAGAVLELTYGPTGDVLDRSDVGAFAYGEGGAAPTAVTSAGPHTYTYDPAGRQTSGPAGAFTYDARDRLTSVTGAATTTLTHGAFEEPAVREVTTGGTSHRVVHLDDLVELHDGQLVLLVTDGTTRMGQLVPGGPVARWHTDHRGSVVLVTTGAGTVTQRLRYDPWGRLLASLPGERPRATYDGYDLLDEAGLYLSPRRPYDPLLGRFLVPDTVASDLWHPVGTNRYAYAGDDPVTVRDPSGRAWWHVALAVLAVVAVVVLTVVTFGVGLISLGAMIGVFAAMAVGATVGGIAAAQAGGDVALGILLGAALAGAAALGGALAGAGFAAAFGAKAFLTHVLTGAVSGLLLGAATGFAAGWAGGQGSLGDVWEKTWQSALVGFVTGLVFGLASYGFAQGWFGTGNIDPRLPTSAEVQKAAAEGAKAAGQAGNAGATAGQAAQAGATAAGTSLAGSAVNFGASSGFNVLQTFVFNPVAMTLIIESVTVVFAFDLVDDLVEALKEAGAKTEKSGTW